jgi:Uma2 family endonuclease
MRAAQLARMMPAMPKVELGRPATYDDLLAVPDHLVAELVDDELWTSPRPAPRHAVASSELGVSIGAAYGKSARGPGGWLILDEPELHLGRHVLVPDIAGWRRERMPRLPATAYFAVAPDWICEVLSPSTELLDRARKLRIYVGAGVGHAWLVNPVTRTLEVLRGDERRWVLLETHAEGVVVRAEPFEAVEVDLAALWEDVETEGEESG